MASDGNCLLADELKAIMNSGLIKTGYYVPVLILS